MYRLLAIDLDGTLLNPERIITSRTHKALQEAAAAGLTIVIVTGQSLPVLRYMCAELPLTAAQIIHNGAMIVDVDNNSILYEQPLPTEQILPALDALRRLGFYRVYHTHQGTYVDSDMPPLHYSYRPPLPPAIRIADITSIYPQPCIKLAAVGEASSVREKRQELERLFAEKLYITQSAPRLLEMMHPDVSKDKALRIITQRAGIAPEEVVAFGDNHNDIGMLRFAGLGVAMGNASDEVKEAADYVTSSNADNGVARVIEEMVLPALR